MYFKNDKKYQADYLNDMAVQLQDQGSFQEALSAFSKAKDLYQEIGDTKGEGRCTNGVGALCKDLGRYSEAKLWLERALKIRQEAGDTRGEALTRITLGPVYLRLGQNKTARQSLMSAVQIVEGISASGLEGQAFFNLGIVFTETGNYLDALNWFKKSLTCAIDQYNWVEENKCLNSLGVVYSALGRFDKSIQSFKKSIVLCKNQHNHLAESAVLENLASLYRVMGEPEQALNLLKQSLTIIMQNDAIELAPNTAMGYGLILLEDLKDFKGARQFFEQALDIAHKSGDKIASTRSLRLIGETCRQSGDLKRAASILEESLSLCHAGGDLEGKANTLSSLSSLEMDLGHLKEATVHAEESLSLAHSIGNAFEEALAMYNLAVLHDMAGRWNIVLDLLESAISIYDRLRYNVSGDDLRISFFDAMKVQNAYYVYVSRLVHRYWETSEKEWAKKAFLISERRRARALLDAIVEQPDEAPQPTPWAVDDIQSRFLDPDTLLLEYSLHDNESYLFAVEKDAFEVYKLPEGLDIFKQVQRLRQIVNNGSIEDFLEVCSALFQTLLGPVAAKITGKKLLVVPDGCLHFLPFQLLITTGASNESLLGDDDGKKSALKLLFSMFRKAHRKMAYKDMPFLLKQNLVEYVPSANIIALTHKKSRTVGQNAQNASFYGFAPVHLAGTENGIQDYGALPATKAEIERIAGLFDKHTAKLYLGEAGTKNAAHICLSSAEGYIHFATHGLVDFDEPRYSALMFHPGQTDEYLLHVSEIMKLRLKADLVVLSACETGLGKTRLGEGVIGLARAFLYAGAKNVCASLWKVADRGTEELMYRFYENLISKKMERSTALQAAQIALLESDTYASPYYWAPFILIGV